MPEISNDLSNRSLLPKGKTSPLLFFIALFFVIASLRLARDILVPLALAALLSFILGPAVTLLEKLKLGRIASVLMVVLASFLFFVGLGWIFAAQLSDVTPDIPKYAQNLELRLRGMKPSGDSLFNSVRQTVKEVNKEIEADSSIASGKASSAPAAPAVPRGDNIDRPMWVRLVEPSAAPTDLILTALSPVFAPLGTAGVVLIFVIFILAKREDLRDRMIRLVGVNQLSSTTEALNDAALKVSRYLLMQFAVNFSFGVAVSIGLYFFGIPDAALWGVVCAVLRFIPYIGSWIGASMPLAIALAMSPSWTQPIEVLALFAGLEMFIGTFMEPLIFGRSTGLSALAIMVAAIFWTWVWGGIGLLMSTPLTVCVVVLGKYVPQLEFLTVLFGDEPALAKDVRFYQRLLASDHEDAINAMGEATKNSSVDEFYQSVVMPAVALAKRDRYGAGGIDEAKIETVYACLRDVIDEAEDAQNSTSTSTSTNPGGVITTESALKVLLLPAYDEGDELSALLCSKFLSRKGYDAHVVSAKSVVSERASVVESSGADVIIISAMAPSAVSHAKYLLKSLNTKNPSVRIIVALWYLDADIERTKVRLRATHHESAIVTNFDDLAAQVMESVHLAKLQQQG